MIDIKIENKIKDKLFDRLSDLQEHEIREKYLIDNYDFKAHKKYHPFIKLIIKDLINQCYIKSLSSSNTLLKIDTLGLEVLKIGSWTKYSKLLEKQSKDKNVHIEKIILKDNIISRDNSGIQSLNSDFTKAKIEKDITNPKISDSKIWTISNVIFAISMGLIVGTIIYFATN